MSTSTFPVIVYGATGFTGRLVAEHLIGRGVTFAIAGRNPDKLAKVAADLGAPDLPVVVADSADRASLDAMAAAADVVISTVGPFARLGGDVVAACVATGTDYVDSTGEPHFVRQMMDEHGEAAAASGARLVHCAGFDSVPSDLGTLVAQTTMHERHGVYAPHVRMRVRYAKGGASGGTLTSMFELLEAAAEDAATRAIIEDPHALMPAGERVGPHDAFTTGAAFDEDHDKWVGPFVMEMINARIVRRSNALLGFPWGREFRYEEGILLGRGTQGRVLATALAAGMAVGMRTMDVAAIRSLVERLVPDPGTGPDEQTRLAGGFKLRFAAEHPEDRSKDVHVKVTADRDPGYGATSRMVGETALALVDGLSEVGGGSWTTAAAIGMPLVERLEEHGGMTFEVDAW